MTDLKYIIKKKWWLILLFLLPSTIIVNLANGFLYPLIMNSEGLYKFTSYFSLVITAILFVIIYSFIESKISKDSLKKTFNILVILISVIFIFTTLMNILVYDLFRYDSCGREFNELYIKNAESNNPSFCLELPNNLNTVIGFKGYSYCVTPNRDSITPTQKHFASTCITSFSKYTNDISHCNLIESHNLSIGGTLSGSGFSGNKYHCIMEYAVDKLKPDLCETLPNEGDFSDRNQCLKIVSWRSGDKSLCEKIPSSSSLKNTCLER